MISGDNGLDEFISQYENGIRSRDISGDEKEMLIRKLHAVWGKGKPENPRGANEYGIKQVFCDGPSSFERAVKEIAEYFGLA
jgi:hypothetical protein